MTSPQIQADVPLAKIQTAALRSTLGSMQLPQIKPLIARAELKGSIPVAQIQIAKPANKTSGPFLIALGHGFRRSAIYMGNFVRGQVVYLDDGKAYPVTNQTAPQAVLNLLAIVDAAGSVGTSKALLLEGTFSDPSLALAAGQVFLGDSGFPVSADDASAHYVPIGYSAGGSDFLFSPRERFFR